MKLWIKGCDSVSAPFYRKWQAFFPFTLPIKVQDDRCRRTATAPTANWHRAGPGSVSEWCPVLITFFRSTLPADVAGAVVTCPL